MRSSETCVMFKNLPTSVMFNKSTTSTMFNKSPTSVVFNKSATSYSTLTGTWRRVFSYDVEPVNLTFLYLAKANPLMIDNLRVLLGTWQRTIQSIARSRITISSLPLTDCAAAFESTAAWSILSIISYIIHKYGQTGPPYSQGMNSIINTVKVHHSTNVMPATLLWHAPGSDSNLSHSRSLSPAALSSAAAVPVSRSATSPSK